MALRLNGSSSGYVELEVPADAGSHTLTLPNSGGSSGQYLQTNGSGTLSWAGAGKILQVQSATYSTETTNATTTYADTGLTDSITPVAAGSSILVIASVSIYCNRTGNSEGARLRLVRGSTTIFGADTADMLVVSGGASSVQLWARNTMPYLDTPTYTLGDEITYKVQFRAFTSSATAQNASQQSSIVLLEVAA